MKFFIDKNVKKINGDLYYLEYEYSFDFEPRQAADSMLSFVYLTLDFDLETKLARQLTGYHHNSLWISKKLIAPRAVEGGLLFEDCENFLIPGVAREYRPANEWQTFFDRELSLVCFGDCTVTDSTECVEIAGGIIVALENHGIKALWLKPIIQSEP